MWWYILGSLVVVYLVIAFRMRTQAALYVTGRRYLDMPHDMLIKERDPELLLTMVVGKARYEFVKLYFETRDLVYQLPEGDQRTALDLQLQDVSLVHAPEGCDALLELLRNFPSRQKEAHQIRQLKEAFKNLEPIKRRLKRTPVDE